MKLGLLELRSSVNGLAALVYDVSDFFLLRLEGPFAEVHQLNKLYCFLNLLIVVFGEGKVCRLS